MTVPEQMRWSVGLTRWISEDKNNMVKESRGRDKEQSDSRSNLNVLLTLIFVKAFPVWEQYQGAVPAEVLAQLDQTGDWPCGIAAAVMKRLSRGPQLRNRLRKRCR